MAINNLNINKSKNINKLEELILVVKREKIISESAEPVWHGLKKIT